MIACVGNVVRQQEVRIIWTWMVVLRIGLKWHSTSLIPSFLDCVVVICSSLIIIGSSSSSFRPPSSSSSIVIVRIMPSGKHSHGTQRIHGTTGYGVYWRHEGSTDVAVRHI